MDETDPPPRKFTLKEKSFAVENHRATPPAPSIHEMLGQNLAVQKSVEPAVLPHLADRRTNRRRDYWVTMLSGNALGAGALIFLHSNPVALVYLLGFFIIFNVCLLWVMYAVMSKY
jgi:hypothetical protein